MKNKLHKWKNILYLSIRRKTQYYQNVISPQISLYIEHNPNQNPSMFVCVCKIWQTDSKFYTEKQNTESYQNSFEDWRMCEGL